MVQQQCRASFLQQSSCFMFLIDGQYCHHFLFLMVRNVAVLLSSNSHRVNRLDEMHNRVNERTGMGPLFLQRSSFTFLINWAIFLSFGMLMVRTVPFQHTNLQIRME